jgi:hypothetical protein
MGEPRFVSRGAVDENGRLSVSAKNFVGPTRAVCLMS